MKNDIQNQTPEERMITTIRYAKNTLYNSDICGKLFQIAHYCEELITANQDTELHKLLDALVDLDDFVKRAKRSKMKVHDVIFLNDTLSKALKSYPTNVAA
ncbi:MAG: hypothetical protein COA58_04050 [Bacteroidetes bacterium]|nr:MAG: hypothetical protein COA58_04050 [Bacteroidota bacterium]